MKRLFPMTIVALLAAVGTIQAQDANPRNVPQRDRAKHLAKIWTAGFRLTVDRILGHYGPL